MNMDMDMQAVFKQHMVFIIINGIIGSYIS